MTATSDTETGPAPTARCERCGYDLRGAMEGWTTFCPVEGRCAECGLSFRWRDVARSDGPLPRWTVEHAPLRRLPLAFAGTLVRQAWPWLFWSRLRMSHEPRPGRLALFVVAMALAAPVIAVTGQAALGAIVWARLERMAALPGDALATDVPLVVAVADALRFGSKTSPGTVSVVVRVPSHRIEPEPPPVRRGWRWLSRALESEPITILLAPADAARRTALPHERSVLLAGIPRGRPATAPYPASAILSLHLSPIRGVGYMRGIENGDPWEVVLTCAAYGGWGTVPRWPDFHLRPALFTAAVCAATALSLALVPVSMRRARVRPIHVVRIAAYGSAIPALVVVAPMAWAYGGALGRVLGVRIDAGVAALVWFDRIVRSIPTRAWLPAVVVALVAWWWAACRCHLRLPHALALATASVVCGALAASLAWASLGGSMREYLRWTGLE